jgi:hypothetical protein
MHAVDKTRIGTDQEGSEYALELVTIDKLSLRFLLSPTAAQTLATALVATLATHGVTVQIDHSAELKH